MLPKSENDVINITVLVWRINSLRFVLSGFAVGQRAAGKHTGIYVNVTPKERKKAALVHFAWTSHSVGETEHS